MILVDLNQIAISNLMVSLNSKYNQHMEVDENLIRHMVLNSLRMYRSSYKEKYGELVLCCDNRNYWRKEIFPFYKASRKKTRASSDYDWNLIFETLNTIRDELTEYFPYKVVNVYRAEADDIIAMLAMYRSDPSEPTLILSGDKDFMQLQYIENVDQYSPVQKKFLRTDDPSLFLKEHIFRGDRSDGIPNCLSGDSVFVQGQRQKPLSTKKLNEWVSDINLDQDQKPDGMDENAWRGFCRNRELIDLKYVPEDLKIQILDTYDNCDVPDRSGLLNFFIQKRLRNLMDCIQEF